MRRARAGLFFCGYFPSSRLVGVYPKQQRTKPSSSRSSRAIFSQVNPGERSYNSRTRSRGSRCLKSVLYLKSVFIFSYPQNFEYCQKAEEQ